MTITGGVPSEFNEIKNGTVELYLAKLDNFVQQIEKAEAQSNAIPM